MPAHALNLEEAFNGAGDFERLVRNVLVRSNFVPAVRHYIGWRGIKDVSGPVEGWTAKIRGHAGIFGLRYDGLVCAEGGALGWFALYYFPDPQEELLETFSLLANHLAQQDSYIHQVRSFLQHPDFSDRFSIGRLGFFLPDRGDSLLCVLEALNAKRSVVPDGIRLLKEDRQVQLVAPGGCDEDIPAFSLASCFMDVWGTSLSFHLGAVPACIQHDGAPGLGTVIEAEASRSRQMPGVFAERLIVGFGSVDGCCCGLALMASPQPTAVRMQWHAGQPLLDRWKDHPWWRALDIPLQQTVDKTFLGVDERPPLMILTGFLGSGKTSFLRHFIEYQAGRQRFVAVIQNEIGATGLDGKLVEDHFTLAEMDEGCVCCTLAGNLKMAVQSILSRFRPDYIVLETTGLANPFNLLDEMAEIQQLVRFDSVTTVIDAPNIGHALKTAAVAGEQIRAADILLINKTDLVDADGLEKIVSRLESINHRAPIVHCRHGDINPGLLYGVDPLARGKRSGRQSPEPAGPHGHQTHLEDKIDSHKITLPYPLERSGFIDLVETGLPETLLRAKGVVQFHGETVPRVFQFVGGRFEISDLEDQRFDQRFLVLIGKRIDIGAIEDAVNRLQIVPAVKD